MEIRVKDGKTGGEKGMKPEAFDLVPAYSAEEVARVYGKGAAKYASRNWERGYRFGLSIAALERHVHAFKRRESIDEDGLHHLAHAIFHCHTLITFERYGLGTDDRSMLGVVAREVPDVDVAEPSVAAAKKAPAGQIAVRRKDGVIYFRRAKNRKRGHRGRR